MCQFSVSPTTTAGHSKKPPLLPKLRGQFAKFLWRASLQALPLLREPTSVGFRTIRHTRLFLAAECVRRAARIMTQLQFPPTHSPESVCLSKRPGPPSRTLCFCSVPIVCPIRVSLRDRLTRPLSRRDGNLWLTGGPIPSDHQPLGISAPLHGHHRYSWQYAHFDNLQDMSPHPFFGSVERFATVRAAPIRYYAQSNPVLPENTLSLCIVGAASLRQRVVTHS